MSDLVQCGVLLVSQDGDTSNWWSLLWQACFSISTEMNRSCPPGGGSGRCSLLFTSKLGMNKNTGFHHLQKTSAADLFQLNSLKHCEAATSECRRREHHRGRRKMKSVWSDFPSLEICFFCFLSCWCLLVFSTCLNWDWSLLVTCWACFGWHFSCQFFSGASALLNKCTTSIVVYFHFCFYFDGVFA